VLIVPHHGSRTSSTDEFIDAVQPKLALIPVGYRSRFRHPHPSVVERYTSRNIVVRRTDLEGALTIKFSADGLRSPEVTSHREIAKRYWTDVPEKKEAQDDAANTSRAQ
jgi:competence protein ComEC